MASKPGPIPPGKEGTISIRVSTSGKGGMTIEKHVSVYTNDPKHQAFNLYIKGKVAKIYSLTVNGLQMRGVQLRGVVGKDIRETFSLAPEKGYPFKLTGVTAQHGNNIKFWYKEVKGKSGVHYDITVENTRAAAGVYFDTLFLKTDSKLKPEIQVSVFASIVAPPHRKAGAS